MILSSPPPQSSPIKGEESSLENWMPRSSAAGHFTKKYKIHFIYFSGSFEWLYGINVYHCMKFPRGFFYERDG
jgi:hypothetical protein